MTTPGHSRAEDLFAAAMDLDPAARTALLRERCADDMSLRREVESLLAHHDADRSFMETPASESAGPAPGAGGAAPEQIGGYRVLGVLGSGGMGVVYRAEQDSPRRLVALKVIRADLSGSTAPRRFQQEGAALARLQHPGIAQVFETGADPATGRAFLAMELIDGRPITQEAAGMDARRILELMSSVCDAVHHAHQRGVVHRDLKPGNILVDRGGRPKILDFGVAALADTGPLATMHTRPGELIGTVAYMSPEQIVGDAGSIDTRTDIYSLGVILFELLSGRLPHDVRRRPLPEAIRLVREEEPTRLSTIARGFRGDIETIVGKAMERDPSRRYASAAEMGADLRRHLADEPIMARPPSAVYQLGKLARRYKALFAAGAVVVVTLAVALGVVSAALINARRAEADARAQAQRAQTVGEFLKSILTGIDPSIARGKDTTLMVAILNEAERRVGELAGSPIAEVEVRAAIGQSYSTISKFPEAAAQLEKAVAIGRADLPPDHAATLSAEQILGSLYDRMDRKTDSLRIAGENVEGWLRGHGPEAPGTLLARNNYGKMLGDHGRHAEAQTHLLAALAGQTRVLGPDHPDTLRTMSNLGSMLQATGRREEAERTLRQVLERRERALGEDHPETLIVMSNLADMLRYGGKAAEAEPLMERALELRRAIMGDAHLETMVSLYNVAGYYVDTGRAERAAPLAERLAELAPSVLGESHGLTLAAHHLMGKLRRAQQRFGEALSSQERALATARASLPPGHARIGIFACAAGRTCIDLERFDDAERLLTEGRGILESANGPLDAGTLTATEMLVDLHTARGNPELAAQWRARLDADRAAAKALQPPVTKP